MIMLSSSSSTIKQLVSIYHGLSSSTLHDWTIDYRLFFAGDHDRGLRGTVKLTPEAYSAKRGYIQDDITVTNPKHLFSIEQPARIQIHRLFPQPPSASWYRNTTQNAENI